MHCSVLYSASIYRALTKCQELETRWWMAQNSCLHGTNGPAAPWVYTAGIWGSLIGPCFQGSKYLFTSILFQEKQSPGGKYYHDLASNPKYLRASNSDFPLASSHSVFIIFHCELQSCWMLELFTLDWAGVGGQGNNCYTCHYKPGTQSST